MKYESHSLPLPLPHKIFSLKQLTIHSEALRGNRLGDSPSKHNVLMVPLAGKSSYPLVVHLSGYYGNGPQSFNQKTMEENLPSQIAQWTHKKKIKPALHLFVDAMTAVGGSQFINSDICGNYSDYIQQELVPAILENYKISKCWVMGGSSGGYGALHHISVKNSVFDGAISLAPDSFFTASLLPDYYKLAPYMTEFADIAKVKKALSEGKWLKKKNFFPVINAVAMAMCYAPLKNKKIQYPIDERTGELRKDVWSHFLKKDPVQFLADRAAHVKNKKIYLEVGKQDEFALYFGARQIFDLLKKKKIAVSLSEFSGGHFGLSEKKLAALEKI